MLHIFKLKTVLIYMEEELNSEEDIERGLLRLKRYKIVFAIFSLTSLADGFAGLSTKYQFSEVDERGATVKLFVMIFVLSLYFVTQTYLVFIGIQQQQMFRKCGNIISYGGDYLVVLVYLLLLLSLARSMSYPIVQYLIVTDVNYYCETSVQSIITVLRFSQSAFRPLGYQILYIAMFWQLISIQNNAADENTTENERSQKNSFEVPINLSIDESKELEAAPESPEINTKNLLSKTEVN